MPYNLQVIHFTIHNAAAPNVRCSVQIAHNFPEEPVHRCQDTAVWGVVSPDADTSNYRLSAYCDRHFRIHEEQVQRER